MLLSTIQTTKANPLIKQMRKLACKYEGGYLVAYRLKRGMYEIHHIKAFTTEICKRVIEEVKL